MTLFKTLKMEGDWWGVFIVNSAKEQDRYLVTSPFNNKKDADHFTNEFNRIAGAE